MRLHERSFDAIKRADGIAIYLIAYNHADGNNKKKCSVARKKLQSEFACISDEVIRQIHKSSKLAVEFDLDSTEEHILSE